MDLRALEAKVNGSPTADDTVKGADGPWVISSYADARSILVSADALVPADVPPSSAASGPASALVERGMHLRSLWMWGGDAGRRIACRKAAASALGADKIASLAPVLESHACALLDAADEGSAIDLVGGFARPLVRDSLMTLFGIPVSGRDALETQVEAMSGFIPGCERSGTARYFALAATAGTLAGVWQGPLPPLAAASRVLHGAVEAGEMSLDEALAQGTLLLFGNSYTTLDALVGLLARLAGEPASWQAVRSGSLPVAGLVEESLRLGPPSHLVLLRDAVRDIRCSAGTIPAGARIVLPLNLLNRDPARFEDAESFEPDRARVPHLAFGAGRHMCVGLHLARTVIRIAIEALVRRLSAWPADTKVSTAPGILGGASVAGLVVPAKALHPC